jgi:hypothetical protein
MKKSLLAIPAIIVAFVSNAQNVGIGTNDPQARLHVETGFTGEAIRLASEYGSHVSFRIIGSPASNAPLIGTDYTNPSAPDFRMSTPAGFNLPIRFYTNDNLRMNISGDGNVGIGTGILVTPAAMLHVNSPVAESFRLQGPAAYQTFYNNNNYMGYIQAWTDALAFGSTPGNALRFYTNGGTERMTVLGNGNVGVNNNNPAHKLDINGNMNLNGVLRINNNSGVAGQVLVSNGNANPSWQNLNSSFNNQVRFGLFYTSDLAGANPVYNYTTRYNTSPADVNIAANSITINKSGLYHFEGFITLEAGYSSLPSFQHFSFGMSFGTSATKRFASAEPMNRTDNSIFYYEKVVPFSAEVYLQAPATIATSISIFFGAPQTSKFLTGHIYGHLISE